jgi:hypothetical protein
MICRLENTIDAQSVFPDETSCVEPIFHFQRGNPRKLSNVIGDERIAPIDSLRRDLHVIRAYRFSLTFQIRPYPDFRNRRERRGRKR